MNLTPSQQKNLGIFLSRGHVKWEEVEAALDIKMALGQSPLRMISESQKDEPPNAGIKNLFPLKSKEPKKEEK